MGSCLGGTRLLFVCLAALPSLWPQIIQFDSGGLRYQAQTKGGVTVMYAPMPIHIHQFAVLQVAVSNGSAVSWTIKPTEFRYVRTDGGELDGEPAVTVVNSMLAKARRTDVIKLITTYESGIYGNERLKSTNGYEARRQSMLAEFGSARLKAAAAASAIAFVPTKLSPGESTDGAVFFASGGKPLGAGTLMVHVGGESFSFPSDAEPQGPTLKER